MAMQRDETFSSSSTAHGDLLHNCSPRCPNGPAAARDELARILRKASETDANNLGKRFVSQQALADVLDTQTIRCLLNACTGGNNEDGDWVEEAAAYISPEAESCRCCKKSMCTGARIIFVMLSFSSREDIVRSLPGSGICDSDLPFRAVGTRLRTQTDKRCGLLDAIQKWTTAEKQLFCHFQWAMLPPFFERKGVSDVKVKQLDTEVCLPWCEDIKDPWGLLQRSDEACTSMYGKEKTIIRKVKISKHCHNFETTNEYFALKNSLQKTFLNEVEANTRMIRGHNNIVPLLYAFEHDDRSYMLFPWAESGSLDLFWEEYPARPKRDSSLNPPWRTPSWLWEQCSGLASALSFIHGYPSPEGEAVPQWHADIQPKNILCFKTADRQGAPSYILRISDFEFAEGHESPTAQVLLWRPPIHPIYYPPELRTPDHKQARVTLKRDVWSLACVFLELLSWFALGDEEGVKKFISDREDEGELSGPGSVEIAESAFFCQVKTENAPFWRRLLGYSEMTMSAAVSRPVREKILFLKTWWCEEKQRWREENRIWGCEGRIEELVGLIEDHMLVVDVDRRATSDFVRRFFSEEQLDA